MRFGEMLPVHELRRNLKESVLVCCILVPDVLAIVPKIMPLIPNFLPCFPLYLSKNICPAPPKRKNSRKMELIGTSGMIPGI